jgi:hypothetical protein
MSEKIEFNEERHEYRVNGVIVPSVTQVLQSVGLPDFSGIPANIKDDVLEWKSGLGKSVHKATELDDLGVVDNYNLDPRTLPFLEAYRRFKRESGFQGVLLEEKICNPTYQYTGTLDRVGVINGKYSLIDFKTGITDPKVVGPQTAAYVEGVCFKYRELKTIRNRYALKLNKDATYKLIKLDNKMDFQIFLNALNLYKWKNGGK